MIFTTSSTECGKLILRKQLQFVKTILVVNYFRKTPHRRCLTGFWVLHHRCLTGFWVCLGFWIYQRPQYTGILNITGLWIYLTYMPVFWICFWLWICQGSRYTTVLNMPALDRVLSILEYVWIIPGMPGFGWMCINLSEWLLFYIYLYLL